MMSRLYTKMYNVVENINLKRLKIRICTRDHTSTHVFTFSMFISDL